MRLVDLLKKMFRSVFSRLLLIIFLTGAGINLLTVGFFYMHRSLVAASFERNLVRYIDYLMEDVGSPPSLKRAREISAETGIIIRYSGQQESWSTSEGPSVLSGKHMRIWLDNGRIRAGSHRRGDFFQADTENGRYLFEMPRHPAAETRIHTYFLMFLAGISLLLLFAYGAIRWILRPVRWLDQGVRQVALGHLDHRIPRGGKDELGHLAAAFNDMTDRMGRLIRAKERLLLDVSHELRSPLTRMRVALEMLADSENRRRLAEDVGEMEQMVSEILEQARTLHEEISLNRKEVDLGALVRQVADGFENMPPGIRMELMAEAPMVPADPDRVKTVLSNVIANALKYSEPGGHPVQIFMDRMPPFFRIRVRDHGIGIPVEDLPFIFEPFYRVDRSRSRKTGGYGLGLSLSRNIVEAHGGRIEITSAPQAGTTVSILFPEAEPSGNPLRKGV